MTQSLDHLFQEWKQKLALDDCNFCEKAFNEDGIIEPDQWDRLSKEQRVLFVLKETNELEGSLTEYLRNGTADQPCPKYGAMWHRVAEWCNAVQLASETVPAYVWMDTTKKVQLALRRVAVMNLKKTAGKSHSVDQEIVKSARTDGDLILQEIEVIDPSIIIFCGTAWHWNEAFKNTEHFISYNIANGCAWKHLGGRERLFIDFYHPADYHTRAIIGFYALASIYRNALINHECKPIAD